MSWGNGDNERKRGLQGLESKEVGGPWKPENKCFLLFLFSSEWFGVSVLQLAKRFEGLWNFFVCGQVGIEEIRGLKEVKAATDDHV